MTRPPEFDELLDADIEGGERERLRRVHDLLVSAGPPPELSPELERGPALALTLQRPRRTRDTRRTAPSRRSLLLAAALVVLVAAFFAGYATGNKSTSPDEFAAGRSIQLHATGAAPTALAAIRLGTGDGSGNWSMHLVASGLPSLPKGGYYEVFLTRHGKAVAPCGSFIVRRGNADAYLNAPYRLRGAGWVVTAQQAGDHAPGRVVLTT